MDEPTIIRPRRLAICGLLCVAASVASWVALYGLVKFRPNGQLLLLGQMTLPFAALAAMLFAVVALARRERFWLLPLLMLLINLALVGLLCWAFGHSE